MRGSNWLDLDVYIARLLEGCKQRNEIVEVRFGQPVIASSIASWEVHFNRRCPKELVELASAFDGATFSASSKGNGEEYFTIRSLEEMVRYSQRRIVDFFALVAEDPTNAEVYSHRRALQLCDVVTFGDSDQLCMIDFGRSEANCIIVDSSKEDADLPFRPLAVADSLATLIRRCLRAKTIGGICDGFCYFWPPSVLDGTDEMHWLRHKAQLDNLD